MKWIEVNINCPTKLEKNNCLKSFIKPVLAKYGKNVCNWHFLWESKPYKITLMVRFNATEEVIAKIQKFLEDLLKETDHGYGCHGNCGKDAEYRGEAENWGSKGWEYGIKLLELGSDFALDLVEHENNLGKNEDYLQEVNYYADRYTHLFLNQISSLTDEADFYLDEGIFRYLLTSGIQLSQKQVKELKKKTKAYIFSEAKKL